MLKSYSRQYLWIWWKTPKKYLGHVHREQACYEKKWCCFNDLPDERYPINADDKIPNNCNYRLATVKAVKNQKQASKEGLAKFFKLKIPVKVMFAINLDIQNCLINSQTGNFSHIEFPQGIVRKVYVTFSDNQAGLKAMRWPYLGRETSWIPIKNVKLRFQ